MNELKALALISDIKHNYINQQTGVPWTNTEELLAEYCQYLQSLINMYDSNEETLKRTDAMTKIGEDDFVEQVELWVEVFNCTNCSGDVIGGDSYCSSCGVKIEWVE